MTESHRHLVTIAFPQIQRDENSLILQPGDGEDILQIAVKDFLAKVQMRKRGELRSPLCLNSPSSPSPLLPGHLFRIGVTSINSKTALQRDESSDHLRKL